MNYKFKNIKKFSILILFFIFFITSEKVFAVDQNNAKVYFQSAVSVVAPKSEFLVSVYFHTLDPVNAFDLEVVYPQDKLQFLNSDNTNSVVDIWQSSPTILPNGNLRLTGGILKAFNGTGGLIIKMSFRAEKTGKIALFLVKNNLYLADGKGTEVKADTEIFSILIEENAKAVFSSTVPFKSTPADILIAQELKTFKSEMFWKKISIPLLILAAFLLVICLLAVYNKLRRKP